MATNAIALSTWSIEYHQTMAAAEQARLDVAAGIENIFRQALLMRRFKTVTDDTEKLIVILAELESKPSSVLLSPDAGKIPGSLRDLFQKMCDVLRGAQAEGLHKTFLLKSPIAKMSALSQQITGFADRYEDAQKKLRSRVSPQETVHYREAFQAYADAHLASEQATEEDVKTELLHF